MAPRLGACPIGIVLMPLRPRPMKRRVYEKLIVPGPDGFASSWRRRHEEAGFQSRSWKAGLIREARSA